MEYSNAVKYGKKWDPQKPTAVQITELEKEGH
jgi:hypothetical protein